MARTKDEKYIICIYEMARDSGDVFNPVDRYEAATMVGMNPKGVDNVCRLLAQANFVKNVGEQDLKLTEQGKKLVEDLLGE